MRVVSILLLAAAANGMNTRQKIACDMCMNSVKDCGEYSPDPMMLNNTRPDPSKLGSLVQCDASEEEIWTTSGYFKVGDEEHPPGETRHSCPCNENEPDGPSCRRQSRQDGKEEFAQDKICGVLINKRMPQSGKDGSCTAWVGKVVPNSQGGDVEDCSTRFDN